jgi:hypothetical protein
MKKYIFYPRDIDDFEKEFNQFIEGNLSIEIEMIHFSLPFINKPEISRRKLKVAIVYV